MIDDVRAVSKACRSIAARATYLAYCLDGRVKPLAQTDGPTDSSFKLIERSGRVPERERKRKRERKTERKKDGEKEKVKVLLVDDHPLFREGVALLPERLDPSVSTVQADTCAEA